MSSGSMWSLFWQVLYVQFVMCRNQNRDRTTNRKRKRVWKRFGVATI